MKFSIVTAVLAIAATGAAFADCEYQGRTYTTGSTICSAGGWLDECTVAGYWKTIGQCRAPDPQKPAEYTVIPTPETTETGKEAEKAD